MMSISRIFNSKWGIAVLVCIAGYVVFQNAVQPFLGSELDYEDTPFFEDDEFFEEATEDQRALKSVNINKLYWNEDVMRDPFGPESAIPVKQVARTDSNHEQHQVVTSSGNNSGQVSAQSVKRKSPPVPSLSSFLAGEISRKAILNDQIVSEGDRVDDFLVLAITPDGVLLRYPDGSSNINLKATP